MLNKLSFNLAKELNESETRKFKIKKKVFIESTGVKIEENKKLTEGAGAGYSVDGTIVNPVVNSFKIINDETDKYGYHSYELECDIDAEITDVKAYSYYDGGDIDGNISVKITGLSINQEKDEYELTNEEIKDSIDGASFKSKHGGGWSHVTFSGSLDADLDSSYYGAYYSSNATITIKSQDIISGIDQLVQGVDYAYNVLDENNELVEGYFDDEDEAIKYAKETEEAYYVVEVYLYVTGASVYNDGDNQYLDIDTDYDDYKVIWSKDENMEESSLKKPTNESALNEEENTITVRIDDDDAYDNRKLYEKLESKYNLTMEFFDADDFGNTGIHITGTRENIKNALNELFYPNIRIGDEEIDDMLVEESEKKAEKSLKEGFKLGEAAEIVDTCERRGQPIALVNLSKIKSWEEYVVAFGYTTENDEVSWDYGYYYYDEESAKEAFEKVKAGGNLSESAKVEKKPIVEAAETEVKDLQVIKEQGNVYMLEDKSEGTRYIVGENYNLSEGEIENAEIYESKEEADKDYLNRCEITTTDKSAE